MTTRSDGVATSVVQALLPLCQPCAGFSGTCRGEMRWDPARGHLPRGCYGATGDPAEVRLALVCAEPGGPYADEDFGRCASPEDFVRRVHATSSAHKSRVVGTFERNLARILEMAWPGESAETRLELTWITDSVLCSAPVEGRRVSRSVELECVQRHLMRQLAVFPNLSRVVAVGSKSRDRLIRAGVDIELARRGVGFAHSKAAAPPGCNFAGATESWQTAVAGL